MTTPVRRRPGGQGLSGAQLQRPRHQLPGHPGHQEVRRSDKGKSQVEKDKFGENFYNRGVINAVVIAEAIRNAQKITGKKDITGDEMRRGLETLQITAARWKELGLAGLRARRST